MLRFSCWVTPDRGTVVKTKRSLVLPASPPSVKLARSWVSRVLTEIGRGDLVDSAALGVSELVTNALIHSRPPLSVRIRGTVDHPRIEVVDSSPVPPQRAPVVPQPEDVDDDNVTTFGRGLDLVAMMSSRWGSDLAHDGRSKSVWFEPTDGAHGTRADGGEVFDFDPDFDDGPPVDEDRLPLRLLNVPARVFAEMRRYHFEVRRELRLLAMTAPEDYPLAVEITNTFRQSDRERRAAAGISRLDKAISDEVVSIDLDYSIPASTPATMARLRDLLVECYLAFSEEHLLALRPPDLIVSLQSWYFTEFERQARGEDPVPWDGPTSMPPP
ncbi:MAG: ATP-binding protein [Marmoricola sp.]|nr:ATP-binding protein [Marmoricola sp.]